MLQKLTLLKNEIFLPDKQIIFVIFSGDNMMKRKNLPNRIL